MLAPFLLVSHPPIPPFAGAWASLLMQVVLAVAVAASWLTAELEAGLTALVLPQWHRSPICFGLAS